MYIGMQILFITNEEDQDRCDQTNKLRPTTHIIKEIAKNAPNTKKYRPNGYIAPNLVTLAKTNSGLLLPT
jgi:hypothetical protein